MSCFPPNHLNDPRRRYRRRTGKIDHLTDTREIVKLPCPVITHHQNIRTVPPQIFRFLRQRLLQKYAIHARQPGDDRHAVILMVNRCSALFWRYLRRRTIRRPAAVRPACGRVVKGADDRHETHRRCRR